MEPLSNRPFTINSPHKKVKYNLLPIDQPPQSRSVVMGFVQQNCLHPKKKPSPTFLYENVLLIKMFTIVGWGGEH